MTAISQHPMPHSRAWIVDGALYCAECAVAHRHAVPADEGDVVHDGVGDQCAQCGRQPLHVVPATPAQRLLARGANALTDCELVAVLLDINCLAGDAFRQAYEVLYHEHAPSLSGAAALAFLDDMDLSSLLDRGIVKAAAARLIAALELARRVARARVPRGQPLGDRASLAKSLTLNYSRRDQEVLGAMYVDVRGGVLSEREHFVGGLDRIAAEPRVFLKHALRVNATALLIFHNHPSGDPEPSPEDIAFTRRLARAGAALGVELVDHLILGAGQWVSMRERGLL